MASTGEARACSAGARATVAGVRMATVEVRVRPSPKVAVAVTAAPVARLVQTVTTQARVAAGTGSSPWSATPLLIRPAIPTVLGSATPLLIRPAVAAVVAEGAVVVVAAVGAPAE